MRGSGGICCLTLFGRLLGLIGMAEELEDSHHQQSHQKRSDQKDHQTHYDEANAYFTLFVAGCHLGTTNGRNDPY